MARGLEDGKTTPVRALAVGSSEWLRTAMAGLADESVTVTDSVATAAAVTDDQFEAANCLLTDDPEAVAAVDEAYPIVYAVDPARTESIDRLPGDPDVIAKTTIQEPRLLAQRLRRAVAFAAMQQTVDRRTERFQTLLEHSSDVVLVADSDGEITHAGPAGERVGGVDADGLCGSHIRDHVHSDDVQAVTNAFAAVRAAEYGTSRTVEYACRHADGEEYVHEATLTNRLGDDAIDGVVASIRDITEYNRIERELSASFKRVTDAFYALDADWRFTYVNDRALEQLDFDRSDILGRYILDVFPEMTGTVFQHEAIEAMASQESRTAEGYYERYDAWIEATIYPSPSGISVYWRDVTERIERERNLTERTERLQALVENAPVVLFALDDEGTFTLSEGRGLANLGFDPEDVVGNSVADLLEDYPEARADAETALEGETVDSRRRLGDRVFETWYRPITDDEETVDRVIGVATDVTERVQYQEALNAVHEASRHLLTVDSKADAFEYVVDIAADVLDLDGAVYRFDDRENELVPAAWSPALESAFGSPPRLQPNDGIVWEAFVDGESVVADDIGGAVGVYDEPTVARSGLCVPLGEHGVFVALSANSGGYDDETVELAQLFAATAEAALDRIGRTRRLRERERELEQQNRHLERLNEANEVRQAIEQHLLLAGSRAEIEREVPDLLADLEACSFAWIGEPDPSGNRLEPRASAGLDRGYLDAVTVTAVDESAAEPAGRAARTRAPVAVDNVADAVHDGEWRGDALSRNFQSVYAVPLVYDGFLYGVLSLYGEEREAFDETFRSTVAELGETIAYAIDAVKRKNALVGDEYTEVELEVAADAALCRLAAVLDEPVTYEGTTVRADGSRVAFVAVEDPVDDPSETVDCSAIDGIGAVSMIAEHEGETVLQVRLTDPFLGSIADSRGARLREFAADESGGRAIVDVPEAAEIRAVLSAITRNGPSVSMVARREQRPDEPSALGGPARTALLDRFTDRQREVVQTAYHGGFFEWPRRATGEEIAASLEISPPAFHKHVRSAERKLFAALFEGTATTGVN
ncbi:PAS domain S-box protein [Natrinema versiforme]|uniref:PAS sensor protein n=1 Tax=Natrinema versiforme JCM 10478 TaxID=1227496 RepID=L9XQ51_9EURY|nr:PAS domain S-box protein [Natrinema versiforme]ELY63939.1 PAS sensor protein [Natrinema versiforme JCM 10478]